jgi:hypothetical protein
MKIAGSPGDFHVSNISPPLATSPLDIFALELAAWDCKPNPLSPCRL